MPILTGLLPLVPLLSAVLILIFAQRSRLALGRMSVAFATASFVLSGAALALYLYAGDAYVVASRWAWGALYADPLAIVMALVVSGISLVVHVYSLRYMVEERGYARFFALLDLMTAAILLLVAAADLITLLIAWHLIGVLLYFLLGHDLQRPAAQRYAFWTFFTYRLGDVPLVLAAVLLFDAFGTLSLPQIFAALDANPGVTTIFGFALGPTVAFLIALAAFARSAQFPLHTWLPYSMEGPTPVSALMHAGVVNAGGFIINRFAPVFVHGGGVLHLVFAVGLLTAVLGSALMLTQNDVKKALGYSTMGQMGFMFVECGVGAFSLAIYHLIAHGLFKGTLFLGAGNVIGNARKHDGVPPDEVYTFVIERKPLASNLPWVVAAAITVIVPLVVLGLSHVLTSGSFIGQQGGIILLFFGWVTGAQLLFATYRTRVDNPWRLMAMMILSLIIVVAGYSLIEHTFDLFLYPNRELSERIFEAASIPMSVFVALVALLTLAIVLGWLATYYAAANRAGVERRPSAVRLAFYSLISREFYISDIYTWLSQSALKFSRRLNVWLRWS